MWWFGFWFCMAAIVCLLGFLVLWGGATAIRDKLEREKLSPDSLISILSGNAYCDGYTFGDYSPCWAFNDVDGWPVSCTREMNFLRDNKLVRQSLRENDRYRVWDLYKVEANDAGKVKLAELEAEQSRESRIDPRDGKTIEVVE